MDGQLRLWARSQERAGVAHAAILVWTRVHGIVSLELTGAFDNHTINAQRLIDLEVDNAGYRVTCLPPSVTTSLPSEV
ncbi:hypothetical protein SAMN04487983_105653 [Streptomyces sp. yr375]|nr:hypothetical protein SAMN04487983_105653 [Streptomyces sp. yr375]